MSSLIQRQELETLLSKSDRYTLTLLVAPAGSGKTTLLDQWQFHHGSNLIARINLRQNQRTLKHALKHMLSEIRQQVEVFDAPIFNLFEDQAFLQTDLLVDSVVQVLNSIKRNISLVVDDFHLLDEHESKPFFLKFMERIPGHVHFIISSRTYPKINLSRLKLSDRMLQIDASDFMLGESEAKQLANKVLGYDLSDKQLVKLMNVTEGWFAGIKIALLAVSQHGDHGLQAFNGGQPDMMEYFANEVYEDLSEGNRQFFLVTSLLERFNLPLCENLFHNPDTKSILWELLEQSAFIIEDQSQPGWYRYHSLLLDFLIKKRKEHYSEKKLIELHRSCMLACEELGEYEMAVHHGSLINNQTEYLNVLQSACDYWQKQGEFTHVIKALDDMPEEVLLANDQLFIVYVYSLILSRRFNQADYFLSLLNNAGPKDQSRTDRFHGDIDFLWISLKLFQQDISYLTQDTYNKLLTGDNQSEIRMFSLVIVAYFQLQHGNLREAMRLSMQAKSIMAKRGLVYLESYTDLLMALCDRYMGRGIESVFYITGLYHQSDFKKGGLPWVSLNTAMMVVYYEQNDIAKSKHLAEQLLPSLTHTCVTEVVSTIYLSLSRLFFIEGNYSKAQRILDQLDRILILGNYPRFCSQSLCEMVRQAYLEGDHVKVKHLADKHSLLAILPTSVERDGYFNEECERKTLAAFYVCCLIQDYDKAKILMLDLADQLETLSLVSRAVIARCNLVVLEYKTGSPEAAIRLLKNVITQYGITSFCRSTFDEAPCLDQVFSFAFSLDSLRVPSMFKQVFSKIFTDAEVSDQQEELATDELPLYNLTEKELLIYDLLSAGLSNADISEKSQVALSTTKWHLKNIYQKLGVSNRAEAIARKPSVLEY